MKNQLVSANDIYTLIRDAHISSFPHRLGFEAINVLNDYIRNENEHAYLNKIHNDLYSFENPHPTVKLDSPFENAPGTSEIKLEAYLSKSGAALELIQDTNAMYSWLCHSGFINGEVATEKMLNTSTLIQSQRY